jgi:hypothetical protein
VIGAEVVEIVRANPEFVMLVMDREGRPGLSTPSLGITKI